MPPITQRKNRLQPCERMPMPISAAPAIRKTTPLMVTVAIVAASAKIIAATPSTTSKIPKATIAPQRSRKW